MVLKGQWAWESPEGFWEHWLLGVWLAESLWSWGLGWGLMIGWCLWSWGLGWDLMMGISNKVPGTGKVADLEAVLWGPLASVNSCRTYKYPVWYYIPSCLGVETDAWEVAQVASELQLEPKSIWTKLLAVTTEHTIFFCSSHPPSTSYDSSLQTTKHTHPRSNQSSPENAREILSTCSFCLWWANGAEPKSRRGRQWWLQSRPVQQG